MEGYFASGDSANTDGTMRMRVRWEGTGPFLKLVGTLKHVLQGSFLPIESIFTLGSTMSLSSPYQGKFIWVFTHKNIRQFQM